MLVLCQKLHIYTYYRPNFFSDTIFRLAQAVRHASLAAPAMI